MGLARRIGVGFLAPRIADIIVVTVTLITPIRSGATTRGPAAF
jgi:hypothetical protein